MLLPPSRSASDDVTVGRKYHVYDHDFYDLDTSFQPAKLQIKQCGGVFFMYIALHFECRFNKNSLLQCVICWRFYQSYNENYSVNIFCLRGTDYSNFGGVCFLLIGILNAVLYSQEYSPPRCVFCDFAVSNICCFIQGL